MYNIINIAKKEFQDLLNSKLVLFILLFYFIVLFKTIFYLSNVIFSFDLFDYNRAIRFLGSLSQIFTGYGVFIAIVIGFALISSEKYNNALNTLIVKPVYRDTIINGKLLGAFAFMACVFVFITIVYSIVLLVLYGELFVSAIPDYLSGLPLLLFISLAYVTIFMSLSMLMSLLVRDQALGLTLGVVLLFISDSISTVNISPYISRLLNVSSDTINFLSPRFVFDRISMELYPPVNPRDPNVPLMLHPGYSIWPDMTSILLLTVVTLVISYIVFLRKDVS